MGVRSWVKRHRILTGIVIILICLKLLFSVLLPVLGVHLFVQTSGSMEPALQRGDLVVVTETPFADIEEGDIVMYEPQVGDMLIAHRVINRTETALETQGDNNVAQIMFCVQDDSRTYPSTGNCPNGELVNVEKNITQDQVQGTAVLVIPRAGYLLRPDAAM